MSKRESLTTEELFADADADPERRARWERLALARAVADAVLDYRVAHKLSQRALAKKLGMKPSAVGRLELAEHNPSIETLQHLASVLELHILLEVVPAADGAPVPLPAQLRVVADHTAPGGERLRVAVG